MLFFVFNEMEKTLYIRKSTFCKKKQATAYVRSTSFFMLHIPDRKSSHMSRWVKVGLGLEVSGIYTMLCEFEKYV
jgi:hypothetical protein